MTLHSDRIRLLFEFHAKDQMVDAVTSVAGRDGQVRVARHEVRQVVSASMVIGRTLGLRFAMLSVVFQSIFRGAFADDRGDHPMPQYTRTVPRLDLL